MKRTSLSSLKPGRKTGNNKKKSLRLGVFSSALMTTFLGLLQQLTLISFVPDAPVSYPNGKIKSNNAWGISGNFLSCQSLYPTQLPISLCLTKTHSTTSAFIGKTSILIHFLWYTTPPHYRGILFMPKCVTQTSIWPTHMSHLTYIISVWCTSLTAVFSMVSKWH